MKIPHSKPFVDEEDVLAVSKQVKSGSHADKSKVEEFEYELGKFIGMKYAKATSSGTTALHLSLLALGIKKGDEVIIPSYICQSVMSAVEHAGAIPIPADCGKNTFNISKETIYPLITEKTKAIIVSHMFGLPAKIEEIKSFGIPIIEDCAHCIGGIYNGKMLGSFGDISIFSFYATKNMTTGEGGMLTTNNDAVFEKLKLLRNHGQSVRYYHEITGYNFRMTDINAAIGIEQLKKLDSLNSKRKENAVYLSAKLENVPGIKCPNAMPNREHVFHQFTILVEDQFPVTRDALIDILKKDGINSGLHYPVLLSDQKSVKEYLNGVSETFEVAEDVTKRVLSLPIHPALTTEDLNYIAKVLYDIKK